VFIVGTSTKQREFPKIAGRNTKANVFQKGRYVNIIIEQQSEIIIIMMMIIIISSNKL
jgi:hypothetical protein